MVDDIKCVQKFTPLQNKASVSFPWYLPELLLRDILIFSTVFIKIKQCLSVDFHLMCSIYCFF